MNGFLEHRRGRTPIDVVRESLAAVVKARFFACRVDWSCVFMSPSCGWNRGLRGCKCLRLIVSRATNLWVPFAVQVAEVAEVDRVKSLHRRLACRNQMHVIVDSATSHALLPG